MKHVFMCAVVFFTAASICAMNVTEEFNADEHVHDRSFLKEAKVGGYDPHSKFGFEKPVKIIIGHTVTDLGDSISTLKAIQENHMKTWADIGYHCCFDRDGECFECRPSDVLPVILKGKNAGSYAVGLIGRFDEQGIHEITEEMVKRWGKQLGRIAHKLGMKELIRHGQEKANIFGMSELASNDFPVSPGSKFMAKFDNIVRVANVELERRMAK